LRSGFSWVMGMLPSSRSISILRPNKRAVETNRNTRNSDIKSIFTTAEYTYRAVAFKYMEESNNYFCDIRVERSI
jgi:hypothetical protein